MRVGLLGRDSRSGLGYQNAAIANQIGIDRWLVPQRPLRYKTAALPTRAKRVLVSRADSRRQLASAIGDLDCLLFAEQPDMPELVRIAKRNGIIVACVPNWEHLAPDLDWIRSVDLMICPTRATHHLLSDWRDRFVFDFGLALVPWPIELGRHRFRQRQQCRRVVYINGWGGCRARRLDGSWTEYRRKGLDTVMAAAALTPELRFIVHSQVTLRGSFPPNVEIRGRQIDNRSLYDVGDVCLQPSLWEGIGLPLLECQAAGLPLITTDASPMNEYQPLAVLPVTGREIVQLSSHPFLANSVDPAAVADVLRRIHNQPLAAASHAARNYVETEHSWASRGPQILAALQRALIHDHA